jgi:hypothetical protein
MFSGGEYVPVPATYIELSDALRKLLSSKRVNLPAELQKRGFRTELRGLALTNRPQVREPFLVILASAVAVALVGSAVSQIIASVADHKRSDMTERYLQVAIDGKGDAIIDKHGNPVYNLAEKPGQMNPRGASAAKLVVAKLLSFDISTGAEAKRELENICSKSRSKKKASVERKSGRS